MTVPALPLPGHWLLAHALLFTVVAALVIGTALVAIVVGQVVAWGFRLARDYWRAAR